MPRPPLAQRIEDADAEVVASLPLPGATPAAAVRLTSSRHVVRLSSSAPSVRSWET